MRPAAIAPFASLAVVLALAGCVTVTITPPAAPAVVSVAPAVESTPVAAIPGGPTAGAMAPVAVTPPAAAPVPAAPPAVVATPPAVLVKPAPAPATKPAAIALAPAKVVAVAPPVKPSAPTLDLTTLETRLRATSAIGTFTKLSLKNQIGDLLEQFKTFHDGGKPALPALRQRYDLLLLKVLSLLQDEDTSLAGAISASRESIWRILVDPAKFAQLG